ncbi:pyroglutamyl-peptidase 1 isoform X2 [Bombus vancouverensis nearcticus]|uniref:pyroglutamyl-peptidase 1 isoform X2 n=1 Tax=Bombus vancouverensis nearcticus TaxID=2705178 RepID=UPI00402B9A15
MEINKKYTVLVTGFGPFDNHIVNASWEAAKELNKLCINSKELMDVEVIVKEIPVSYEDVTKYVPKFWQEYKPIVVLHLGISISIQVYKLQKVYMKFYIILSRI